MPRWRPSRRSRRRSAGCATRAGGPCRGSRGSACPCRACRAARAPRRRGPRGRRSAWRSARRSSALMRGHGPSSKARRAAASARAASAGPPSATSASSESSWGSRVSKRRPSSDGRQSAPIRWSTTSVIGASGGRAAWAVPSRPCGLREVGDGQRGGPAAIGDLGPPAVEADVDGLEVLRLAGIAPERVRRERAHRARMRAHDRTLGDERRQRPPEAAHRPRRRLHRERRMAQPPARSGQRRSRGSSRTGRPRAPTRPGAHVATRRRRARR